MNSGSVRILGVLGGGAPQHTQNSLNSLTPDRTLRRKSTEIIRAGTNPSGKGPQEWFTGSVRIDPLFTAPDPAHVSIANVTFEPGARTAWHSHPYGQVLIVTFGSGRVEHWGGPVQAIHPGDVVWIPPEEKHWHGAGPTTTMTHISIVEQVPGKAPTWMEKVSDEQYIAGSKAG